MEEKREIKRRNIKKKEDPYRSDEERIKRAKEGYFVRNQERNIVFCPTGATLRQKSQRKDGYIRYANKLACKSCEQRARCYKGVVGWKEIDFSRYGIELVSRNWLEYTGEKDESKS